MNDKTAEAARQPGWLTFYGRAVGDLMMGSGLILAR